MNSEDIFLRRVFLIAAMKKALRKDFTMFVDRKPIKEIIDTIEEDKDDHFLSLSKDEPDKISFATHISHKLDDSKRTKTSLGRYLRRKLDIKYNTLSDFSLEKFVKAVMNHVNGNTSKSVEIISGTDLKEYYKKLHKSYKGLSEREVLFYTVNNKKVSWVVTGNISRALLWSCDDGTKILDTIYPKRGNQDLILKEWARKNDIKTVINTPLSELRKLTITLKCKYIEDIPYQDTFKYAEISKLKPKMVILSSDSTFGNLIVGSKYKPYLKDLNCKSCNAPSLTSELTKIAGKWYCSKCISKNFKKCSVCNKYKSYSEEGITEKGYCKSDSKFDTFDIKTAWACNECTSNSNNFSMCGKCGEIKHIISLKKIYINGFDGLYCKSCITKYIGKCSSCKSSSFIEEAYGQMLCKVCIGKFVQCCLCKKYDNRFSMSSLMLKGKKIEEGVCKECIKTLDLKKCQQCWCILVDTPSKEMQTFYSSKSDIKQTVCEHCQPIVQRRLDNNKPYNHVGNNGYFGCGYNVYGNSQTTNKKPPCSPPYSSHNKDHYSMN